MTPARIAIGIGAIVAVILLFGKVVASNFRGADTALSARSADKFLTTRLGNATDHLSFERDVDSSTQHTLDSSVSAQVIRLDLYNEFLDRLCPRLTTAEEDALIGSGDAQTLVGLTYAGSERPEMLLKEALRRDPHSPLVHYAILAHPYPGFDRLKSALELAKLAPLDAAPLYAAALEAFNRGDRESTISYLTEAAQRTEFSSFQAAARDAAIYAFQLAGRSQDDARTRVLLQNNGEWEVATLGHLREGLGIIGPDGQTLWGSDYATALLLDASQKSLDAPGLDLLTYQTALVDGTDYLRAIERMQASDRFNDYLSVPVPEWLSQLEAKNVELKPILLFSRDKAGVYQRLEDSQKVELIDRIAREGELAAFLWAYQTRPDIFRSSDFRPQGAHPLFWNRYVNR